APELCEDGFLDKVSAGQILEGFAGKRVVVVGDVMLDEYIWGQVNRISPEAPVMVVDAGRYSHVPGGAANVVNNLCVLGAHASIIGVIGEDEAGRNLVAALEAEGADVSGLVTVTDRPTTRKTRIIAHSQQVVRVDHEKRIPLELHAVEALVERFEALTASADAVVLSDYQKGVLAPALIHAAARFAAQGKPVTGNLKPRALSADSSITVITLNLSEASAAMNGEPLDTQEMVHHAGRALLERTGAAHIVITLGQHGLTLYSASSPATPHHVPPREVEVYDSAGAGDTVISAMTMALVAGASPADAVTLANYAAAEAVKKLGVSTVTREEILAGF
ncbi:MAG: PfkB family carbohydrate kinase, partial [Capsulimonas sp.]|uniref:bifunctional heptose 7-phosphate kinase/heptose 1-phosphate adenyltransferase n=1 Tax=Capsulimonas sp. TaxID=2494211 RepID=UPI00326562FC